MRIVSSILHNFHFIPSPLVGISANLNIAF
jgi:hypothetical protein